MPGVVLVDPTGPTCAPLCPPVVDPGSPDGDWAVIDGVSCVLEASLTAIRGVNNPHIWFDVSARYGAYLALDTIASFGTNTIRVVWDTTGSAALLREVLFRVVELDMVPMVELHDVTGSQSRAALVDTAAYYATADVRDVLNGQTAATRRSRSSYESGFAGSSGVTATIWGCSERAVPSLLRGWCDPQPSRA